MGGKRITPGILDYLSQRAGKPVALQRMAADLGLEERQVQQAISHLRREVGLAESIRVLQHGQVWRWVEDGASTQQPEPALAPAPAPTGRRMVSSPPKPVIPPDGLQKGDMVEVMGMTQNGDAVASDENGRLFRVIPL